MTVAARTAKLMDLQDKLTMLLSMEEEEINAELYVASSTKLKSAAEKRAFPMSKVYRKDSIATYNARRFLIDSGASDIFVNFNLENWKPADIPIGTANGMIKGVAEGSIRIHVKGEVKFIASAIKSIGISDN